MATIPADDVALLARLAHEHPETYAALVQLVRVYLRELVDHA